MIQIIIFSFNRALQLDTLLSSLNEYWKKPNYHIDILYNTSDVDFEKGYSILKKKYSNISFHKETKCFAKYRINELFNVKNLIQLYKNPVLRHPKSNFRNLLLDIMKNDTSENVMFMTDDAMFVNQVDVNSKILDWINDSPYQRQYSIRIGKGMNNQEDIVSEEQGILSWNFYRCNRKTNWGYNFSVDGHIYSKKVIVELFSKYIFTNPNSLESFIYSQVRRKNLMSEGKANQYASILSFPINMVQTFASNETLGVDCKMMNDWFLSGYTMKYPVPENYDMFQQYPKFLYLYKDNEVIKKEIQ